MCPIAQSDGHDAPRLVDELVPSIAAVIDDVALGAEDAIGEPVVADELPNVLYRVQLGTFGRQRQERDVRWHDKAVRQMPSGLIDQQYGMGARRHGGRHFGQVQVHGGDVAAGQHEAGALAEPGADRTENVGRGGALVLRRRRPRAASGPTPGDLVLLADPGFIGEPHLYCGRIDAFAARDRVQSGRECFMGWPAPLPGSVRWLGNRRGRSIPMPIAILGIDLGKNSCSLVGLDSTGRVVARRRLQRESVIKFAAGLAPCVVAMEACCGAHHLGRLLRDQGHQVRLMSPEYVRPYVKAQKNDDRDAEAIAEAATRPTMRFVELKTEDQLDMQTLHRVRDRLVGERTALLNQLRALLLERGTVIPKGRRKLEQHFDAMLSAPDWPGVAPRIRRLLQDMRAEWQALDRGIAA